MKLISIFYICIVGVSAAPSIPDLTRIVTTTVHSDGGDIKLKLQKPAESIFDQRFKMLMSSVDNMGGTTVYDVTPSAQAIRGIEDNILIDPIRMATVRVKIVDGKTQLFGEINSKLVHYDAEKDIHKLTRANQENGISDYLEVPDDDQLMFPSISVNRSILAVVSPELFIVVDNLIYQHFSGNVNRIMEYFAIFIRAVNNRYATSSDPRITLKIVGLLVMQTPASQPFLENNRNPDGTYASSQVLADFSSYLATSINIPPNDVAALVTSVNFGNVGGIAYRGPSCLSRNRVSITKDVNGIFSGIHTLAHEIGHNLGSPHDGDEASGTGTCPNTDYFLMSSAGGAGRENAFYFSTCSKQAINAFLGTANANCYYTDESPSSWTSSPLYPGDRVTMLDICRDYRPEMPDIYVSDTHTPDELCTNIRCKYRAPCSPPNEHLMCIWTATLNREAPHGAQCDIGKKCSLGRCV